MEKKYSKYTIDELLLDDYFISSVLHPTPESQEFWEYLMQNEYVKADDFEKASLFVRAMQSPKKKMFRKEKDILWEKIEMENKKNLKGKIRNLYIFSISAAACVFLLLGVSVSLYFAHQSNENEYDPMTLLKNNSNIQESSDIRLVLSESKQMSFEENNAEVKYNEKGEVNVNSQVVVEEKQHSSVAKEGSTREALKTKSDAVVYNQLIVPRGKHSTLLLSDGTKLWVNAGSHVVFPVTFEKEKREIYVDGEVYLEVTRNEACPFIVKTDRMQVNVLGTSFNVKSYDSDEADDVVLVTGSVRVKTGSGQETGLVPNQRFTCTVDGVSNVETVDVYDYICWKDGLLRYKSESLSTILKRLSDYYGEEIRWDVEIENVNCSGKLDLKEDMEKVLTGLTRMIPVKFSKREKYYYFSMNH